jgi:hypothetical protein
MLSVEDLNNTSHCNEILRKNSIKCGTVRGPLLSKLNPTWKVILFLSGLENLVTLKAVQEVANLCRALKYILDTFITNRDYHSTQKVKDDEEFVHWTGELWMVTLNHQAEG